VNRHKIRPCGIPRKLEQGGVGSNARDSYSGTAQFASRPEHQQTLATYWFSQVTSGKCHGNIFNRSIAASFSVLLHSLFIYSNNSTLTVYVTDGVVKQQTRIQITLQVANEPCCHKGNQTIVQYMIMNVCGKLFALRDEMKDGGTIIQVYRV
jgi:hypothetical protein